MELEGLESLCRVVNFMFALAYGCAIGLRSDSDLVVLSVVQCVKRVTEYNMPYVWAMIITEPSAVAPDARTTAKAPRTPKGKIL